MSPAEFMTEIVLPTAIEFRDAPRDRRRAYLACIIAFSACEYLKESGEVNVGERMRTETGAAYDVVRGVCNGSKHAGADRKHAIAFKPGSDYDRPPARAGELQAGISRLGDTIGGREILTGSTGGADVYQAVATFLKAFATVYPVHFVNCDLSVL